jgi:hypothetical protein
VGLLLLQPSYGLTGLSRSGEDGLGVIFQKLKPVGDVLRMVGARVLRDAKLRAQERRADFCNLS